MPKFPTAQITTPSNARQWKWHGGEIAASKYVAANSRKLILDSQDTINKCEVDIPNTNVGRRMAGKIGLVPGRSSATSIWTSIQK